MKIRTLWHSFKESIHNIFTHPLVTIASITTMALMLTLLGAFTLFSLNINFMVSNVSKQPPIEVFTKLDVTAEQLDTIEKAILEYPDVYNVQRVTSEQNLEKFRSSINDTEDAFKYFDKRNIPNSFIVRLEHPEKSQEFKSLMEGQPGVYLVDFSENITEFLYQSQRWVNWITLVIFIVLSVISFFVISNMVRISVFARGDEIEIMKYVGATNVYIRIPYILEGFFVGVLGALLSNGLLYLVYTRVYNFLMQGMPQGSVLSLRFDNELLLSVALITTGLGIVVGMFASGLSVRRHIKV